MVANKGREEWKIYGNVFDKFTDELLHKLKGQGYFDELVGAVSIGKEANIFTAKKKDGDFIIVKIYRLENCNFNQMFNYIKTDPRYMHLKGQKRKIIFEWVRREYRNLLKAREVGVRVPTPIHAINHVILMELVGQPDELAPQVKNSEIERPEEFVTEILSQMRTLYQKGEIVHADLSMFNILVRDQKPVLIDMSQGTSVQDPHAKEYLQRDIHNVVHLAKRVGVKLDAEEVFLRITKK